MSEASPMLVELPYVYPDKDRYGRVRYYFKRARGHRKIRIRERPGTVAFARRYDELLKQSEAGAFKATPRDAPVPGTFRWLCIQYFKSTAFMDDLDPGTQHVTRLIVEKMFTEPKKPGALEIFADCPT